MAKRKAKKRTPKSGSLAGPERMTRQQMLDGVPGPDGVWIGFAAPAEAATMTTLLKAAADDLEAGHFEALARTVRDVAAGRP